MKIRGNAHHVAEKYLQLARDAHTGGDPVAAENYLQHAEHYFRLIAAAQAAQLAAQGRPPGEVDESEEDDDDGGVLDRFASPVERVPPPYVPPPQPVPNGAPYAAYPERQPYDGQQQPERNGFQPRPQQNRHENRNPRPFQERGEGQRDFRNGPNEGRPREFRPYREPNPPRDPQPVIEATPAALPSFITAAPRTPTGVEAPDAPQPIIEPVEAPPPVVEAAAPAPVPATEEAAPEARFPRGRRRRLRSPYGFHAGGEDAPAPTPPSNEPSSAD